MKPRISMITLGVRDLVVSVRFYEGGLGFKDPDGHLWEVAHNPHLWVGPVDSDT